MKINNFCLILFSIFLLACSKEQTLEFPQKLRGIPSVESNGYVYIFDGYMGSSANKIIRKSTSNLHDSTVFKVPSNVIPQSIKVSDNYVWCLNFDDKVYNYNLSPEGVGLFGDYSDMTNVSDYDITDDYLYILEYYGRINRINLQTNVKSTLITDATFYFSLFQNYIYYVNQNEILIQYNIDTKESIQISEITFKSDVQESTIVGNKIIINNLAFSIPVTQANQTPTLINYNDVRICDNRLYSIVRNSDIGSFYNDCILQIYEYNLETFEYELICEPLKNGYVIVDL